MDALERSPPLEMVEKRFMHVIQPIHFVPSDAALVQALEIPSIRNAVIVLSIGYSSYLWFTARFGGFAGRLSPAEALNVLDSEDAVLLDVR